MHVHRLSWLLLFAWVPLLEVGPAAAQESVTSTPGAVAPAPQGPEVPLRPPPRTAEQIQARVELGRNRIGALTRLLSFSASGEDEASVALRQAGQNLLSAWQGYVQLLQRAQQLEASCESRSSQAHLDSLSQEVAQIEQETQAIRNAPVPTQVTEQDVQDAQDAVRAHETEIGTLVESQSRRSGRINEGIAEQQDQLDSELRELARQREQLDAPAPAPDEVGRAALLPLHRERLDVEMASVEFALHTLPLERQEAELLYRQDGARLAALRTKLDVLRKRASRLVELRSRSRIDVLASRRDQAPGSAQRSLVDLQLFVERVLLQYFQDPQRLLDIQKRFPERRAERITERVESSRRYWERALAAAESRRGGDVLELQQQIHKEKPVFDERRAELQGKLARTLGELQRLENVRVRAARRLAERIEEVGRAAQSLEANERTLVNREIGELDTRFKGATQAAVNEIDGVAARLTEAVKVHEEHIARLRDVEQRIRWVRLTTPDSGLMRADYAAAWRDLQALFLLESQAFRSDIPSEPSAVVDRELFGVPADTLAAARALYAAAREGFAGLSVRDWVWSAVLLVVLVVVGYAIYRIARWHGVRLAREIIEQYGYPEPGAPPLGAGLSARIDLLGWNILGDLAIPLCAAGGIGLAVAWLLGHSTVRWLGLTLLGCLAGTIVLLRLVHHLFEADAPAHRPIHCSDIVARHYRWFLSLLALWCFFVLTLPLLLKVAGLAATLQTVLIEFFKTGFLLIVLLFVLPKRRVLGTAGSGFQWKLAFASIAYPVFVIGVIGLLALEVLGYGALVSFVGRGVLLTAGIVVVVGMAMEYLADVIERRAHSPGPAGAGGRDYLAAFLAWAVRLVGLGAMVVLGLRTWGVSIPERWLNWRAIGLGALVVLVALLLDRITSSALRALQHSGRLPESTANISCRWVRSLLVVLALLAIVAIAGFEVGSIWQFITALLAMVAIGFVAVWSMLSNVLATLVILIWRPFNVGEWITLLPEEIEGQVVDINFIYTILRGADGTRTAVPNNLFAQKFIRRQTVRGAPQRTLAEQLEASQPLE